MTRQDSISRFRVCQDSGVMLCGRNRRVKRVLNAFLKGVSE